MDGGVAGGGLNGAATSLIRVLRPGDSLGNTGLLYDHKWRYNAVVPRLSEDGRTSPQSSLAAGSNGARRKSFRSAPQTQQTCILLEISRDDLTDLLRGRRELARSVIRGFQRTFLRRLGKIVEDDGDLKRDWIVHADHSSSPGRLV